VGLKNQIERLKTGKVTELEDKFAEMTLGMTVMAEQTVGHKEKIAKLRRK